jgi:redox-sensing transcriptional repressor
MGIPGIRCGGSGTAKRGATLCVYSQRLNLECSPEATPRPLIYPEEQAVTPRQNRNRDRAGRGIPEATVARLPVYLRTLHGLQERGVARVSSEELASAAGVNSAKLRKDLSHLGSYGTRGVGYEVDYLVYQISRELGLTQDWVVAIIGVGNLGRALAGYGGFASRGFRVAGLLDADEAIVGQEISGMTVEHIDRLEDLIAERGVSIAVIATPAAAAQGVCDRVVAAGVTSVLNFAPVVLSVPGTVEVRKVDLSIELQILAFHEQRKAGGPGAYDPQGGDGPPGTTHYVEAVQ